MKTYHNPSDYFRQKAKSNQVEKIGAEFEHLILNQDNTWVNSQEVAAIMHDLVDENWEMESIEGVFLGLKHDCMWVSLEPGSQFEISLRPQDSVVQIEKLYRKFLEHCLPVIEAHGKKLVAMGFQPITSPEDIRLIDKKRYHFMNEHFSKSGSMGHYMMRASASTQMAVDYFSEEDFREKLQFASRIGPYLALMFDNVSYVHGEYLDESLFRTTVWLNTDDQRSNLVEGGLEDDFGYEAYGEHILNFEPVVVTTNHETHATGSQKTKELISWPVEHDLWEHFLSMAFFDVRAKGYIEIRMIDSLPYPYNIASVAMVKGLMYHPKIKDIHDKFRLIDEVKLFEIKQDLIEKGFESDIYGLKAKDVVQKLYYYALEGLTEDEKPLLQIMEDMVESGQNFHVTKDVTLEEAVRRNEVHLESSR